MMDDTIYIDVNVAIERERRRQDRLFRDDSIPIDCANPLTPGQMKLGVLVEEIGEVAKVLVEEGPSQKLYDELVQTAAVAHAWAEAVYASIVKENLAS